MSRYLRVRRHQGLLQRLEGAQHARNPFRHRRLVPDDQGGRGSAHLCQHQEHAG